MDNSFKEWRDLDSGDRLGDGTKILEITGTSLTIDGIPIDEGKTTEADQWMARAGCRTGLPAIGYSVRDLRAHEVGRFLFEFVRIHELGHHENQHVWDCAFGGKISGGPTAEREADCFAVKHFLQAKPARTKVLDYVVRFFQKRRKEPLGYPSDVERASYISERCAK